MPDYIYSIILILIIIIVVMLWSKKRKDDEWKGELIKKRYNIGDEDSTPSYVLVFKTDVGKKKRFNTPSEKFWNEWEVGDRAEKRKGEFFPTKM